MDKQLRSFADLDERHIASLAQIHCQSMPTSSLSRLGPSLTRRFYASIPASTHLYGGAMLINGQIAGAVVGTSRPNSAFDGITHPLPLFLLRVLKYQPTLLPQLMWSKVKPAHDVARPAKSTELLYIFSNPEFRGQGIGTDLLRHFVDASKARGLAHVTLSVEVDNDAAIGLYQRRGFSIVAERQREGTHICHRMSAPL